MRCIFSELKVNYKEYGPVVSEWIRNERLTVAKSHWCALSNLAGCASNERGCVQLRQLKQNNVWTFDLCKSEFCSYFNALTAQFTTGKLTIAISGLSLNIIFWFRNALFEFYVMNDLLVLTSLCAYLTWIKNRFIII